MQFVCILLFGKAALIDRNVIGKNTILTGYKRDGAMKVVICFFSAGFRQREIIIFSNQSF